MDCGIPGRHHPAPGLPKFDELRQKRRRRRVFGLGFLTGDFVWIWSLRLFRRGWSTRLATAIGWRRALRLDSEELQPENLGGTQVWRRLRTSLINDPCASFSDRNGPGSGNPGFR